MRDPLEQDAPEARAATPDPGDWASTVAQRCAGCGLDVSTIEGSELGPTLRTTVPRWRAVLARADVRLRPRPGVWSPLEYACHVRDALAVHGARLELILRTDAPLFEEWDQDIAALDGEYLRQDPATVADEIAAAAGTLADMLDTVEGKDWERFAHRSDGSRLTVDELARYLLHDVSHHLRDVGG